MNKHDRRPGSRELVVELRSKVRYFESRRRPRLLFMGKTSYFQCFHLCSFVQKLPVKCFSSLTVLGNPVLTLSPLGQNWTIVINLEWSSFLSRENKITVGSVH